MSNPYRFSLGWMIHASSNELTAVFPVLMVCFLTLQCLHIMTQWAQMTQHLQFMATEVLNELYPATFPIDIRHYLASWIEGQQWYDITVMH